MSLNPLRSAKNVSKEWIQRMLSFYFKTKVEVLKFNSKLPSNTQGFLSEISFLSVEYCLNNEIKSSKYVFKFLPTEDDLLSFIHQGGLAKREVDFYRFAQSETFKSVCEASAIKRLVPTVLYSCLDQSALTIVMEDLREDNYELVLNRDGSTLVETQAALCAIAHVHAAGIIYQQKHGRHELDVPTDNSFYDQFLIPNLKFLADRADIDSQRQKNMLHLIQFTEQMRMWPLRYPLFDTVIHGDLWAAQTLFSPNRTAACILDWQFSTIGNPVIDIQAMFFMSSDPVALDEHLEEVLFAYWRTFSDCLKKHEVKCPVSYNQFKSNVENMWICGFMFFAVSIHDFIKGDSISEKRLEGQLQFLEKRDVFSNFFLNCENF